MCARSVVAEDNDGLRGASCKATTNSSFVRDRFSPVVNVRIPANLLGSDAGYDFGKIAVFNLSASVTDNEYAVLLRLEDGFPFDEASTHQPQEGVFARRNCSIKRTMIVHSQKPESQAVVAGVVELTHVGRTCDNSVNFAVRHQQVRGFGEAMPLKIEIQIWYSSEGSLHFSL